MQSTPISDVVRLGDYRTQRVNVFRSPAALEWFVRQHRQALIECGALLMLRGQWHANEQQFDAFVMETGATAAKRHLSAAS